MSRQFIVTLPKPLEGVSDKELCALIREAVRMWGYESSVLYAGYDQKTDTYIHSKFGGFGEKATVKAFKP